MLYWQRRLGDSGIKLKLPDDERALEISSWLDDRRYDVKQSSDGQVSVEPWPFEKDKFIVNIEACDLSQLKFEDDAALKAALQDAPIKILQWQFAKCS